MKVFESELNEVERQGSESGILENATNLRLNLGANENSLTQIKSRIQR
jgi:hypothetical protein